MANISATFFESIAANSISVIPEESDKAKGCGYYGQNDGLHTVQFVLNAFKGQITIQGSLEAKPTDDDWFDVSAASIVATTTPITTNTTKNFKGNFVWVRAVIDEFTEGNINRVLFSHN